MNKILHITNWYPNKWDDLEGIFVKEQYGVFSEVADSHLLNVQVRNGKKLFEYQHVDYSDSEEGYYLLTKIKSTKIIEILTTLLLVWALFKSDYKTYDLLHFHIAYPLLTYYSWWKRVVKIPIVISEHWSAYHFYFYMPLTTKKLDRVKNIFKQNIPLLIVSKALLEDIQHFSGSKDFQASVIPNVIDQKYFHYKRNIVSNETPVFFMVNVWRSIKNPFSMLEAFSKLASQGTPFKLRIGGYGPLLEEMMKFVKEKGFDSQVSFLGKMEKVQIANELSMSHGYLFSSDYETFSVACAQALSCGCPLIGPPIPAVLEYATPQKDIALLHENTVNGWVDALQVFIRDISLYNRIGIAEKAKKSFSIENMKSSYQDFLLSNFINMERK